MIRVCSRSNWTLRSIAAERQWKILQNRAKLFLFGAGELEGTIKSGCSRVGVLYHISRAVDDRINVWRLRAFAKVERYEREFFTKILDPLTPEFVIDIVNVLMQHWKRFTKLVVFRKFFKYVLVKYLPSS